MGAAVPAPPLQDRFLFHFVTLIASLLRAVAASLRVLHRLLRPSSAANGTPPPESFPPHVALAGALASPSDVLRVASLALSVGARSVTVFDPSRPTSTSPSAASIVSEPDCVSAPSAPAPPPGVRFVGADGARAQALVRAARDLARSPRHKAPADPATVMRWLERPETQRRFGGLETEPDVLLVFGDSRASIRCLVGFPVWQLRLTQICFVDVPIERFTADDLVAVAAKAYSAPKRFGT